MSCAISMPAAPLRLAASASCVTTRPTSFPRAMMALQGHVEFAVFGDDYDTSDGPRSATKSTPPTSPQRMSPR